MKPKTYPACGHPGCSRVLEEGEEYCPRHPEASVLTLYAPREGEDDDARWVRERWNETIRRSGGVLP